MVKEQSSREELDDESGSTKGELFDGCYFSPKDLAWKAQIKEACPFDFAAAREGGKTKIEDGIEELQATVEDLAVLYGLVAKALREDSFEVLEYVWLSVAEVIKAIDHLNNRVRVWKEVLGDFSILQEERGANNVCSELSGTWRPN
jgi:hypothetical protein